MDTQTKLKNSLVRMKKILITKPKDESLLKRTLGKSSVEIENSDFHWEIIKFMYDSENAYTRSLGLSKSDREAILTGYTSSSDPNLKSTKKDSAIDRSARKIRLLRSVLEAQKNEKKEATTPVAQVESLPYRCCGSYTREKHRLGCPIKKQMDNLKENQ